MLEGSLFLCILWKLAAVLRAPLLRSFQQYDCCTEQAILIHDQPQVHHPPAKTCQKHQGTSNPGSSCSVTPLHGRPHRKVCDDV